MERPQFTVDLKKAEKNIIRIVEKFARKGVKFRPHFKTHQCAEIGEMFRAQGVEKVTVSSLDMANYFAEHGWDDITLAVPVNLGQIDAIDRLAQDIRLNLLVDCEEVASALDEGLNQPCPVWIKVDVGYGRVGVRWDKEEELLELIRALKNSNNLEFVGLLTHSGHTYQCRGQKEVFAVFEEGRQRMLRLKEMLTEHGITPLISMGDTPSASLAENFDGVDEMRPGNFVFYDLVQHQVGSCEVDEIAVAIACPVIGKYEDDLQVAIYGGSVHLSKDSLMVDGEKCFGRLALPTDDGWQVVSHAEGKVISCCQEVSKIQVSPQVFDRIELGQTVYILPAHSCLAAEVHARYLTTGGSTLERFRLYS